MKYSTQRSRCKVLIIYCDKKYMRRLQATPSKFHREILKEFLKKFKKAFVTPVFKKGENVSVSTYTVSLIWLLFRLKGSSSTEDNRVNQSKSTCTNLIEYVYYVTKAPEEGPEVHSIYTDISKSFGSDSTMTYWSSNWSNLDWMRMRLWWIGSSLISPASYYSLLLMVRCLMFSR